MSPPTPLPRIGITVGEPAGIGPEVISAALHAGAHGSAEIRVYGDSEALERAGGVPNAVALEPIATAKVEPGQPQAEAAHGVVDAIRRAAQDCLAGKLDGMVTGPISKELLGRAGYSYPGHTELLAELSGVSRGVMMLVGGRLRVALATLHCALREVPNQLTTAGLLEILSIMHADLTQRFALSHPRIAVCGLNPHAGEGGRFGDEEERIIQPAVEQAQARPGFGHPR